MGKTEYENNLQNALDGSPGYLPIAGFAALYEVNASTLDRRLAGTTRDYATAARDITAL